VNRLRIAAFLGVLGPGILAGLSDDDPAGITTYSILGADHGYELIWVLVVATAMLILYHAIAVRLGAVTGQGLAGLIRERFGVRTAFAMTTVLAVANLGTTAAEFAGIASALDIAGVPRQISVPAAAIGVSWLVIGSQFKRVEHVLLLLAATLSAYILAGILAEPDWSAAARGALVPSLGLGRTEVLVITATIGTTIAPWGLAFIQSYAVDKRLRPQDLGLERVDVVTGAVLTGVIGFFVVVACAATLHVSGQSIEDARDAAIALEPLAGAWSARLFGAGLLGAALLAVAVVPLATAYSVAEMFGTESRLDDRVGEARVFYGTYLGTMAIGATIVLIPSVPLVPVLYLTQALNAILLVPLLFVLNRLSSDPELMGEHVNSGGVRILAWLATATLIVCVSALGIVSLI
jgi:NRAMP (natural resistance-associated macrophage protein)-like metal ion transporter